MLPALNYPVGLHDLSTATFILQTESRKLWCGWSYVFVAFGVRRRGKIDCFLLQQSFNNNDIKKPNSLDRDQARRFCLTSAGSSEP